MEQIGTRGKGRKGGKKNRKFGRSSRRPGKHRYNAERRWEKNKARRIAKQKRKEQKKREKLDLGFLNKKIGGFGNG
jgi:hypothetical protein